jgi:LmbE family N-acetylglucosaminyl deacetylase
VTDTPSNGRKTVLCMFAHPDDETFGPGGTLARLSHEGHEVHLVCATRGESGTIDQSASFGRRRLAEIREKELIEAGKVLGIQTTWLYTFPDSGLARLEEETLLRPFVRAVRAFRPDIIIVFHENGISGHTDHQTVTARAVRAFDLAADEECWPDLGSPHAVARLWAYGISDSRAAKITTRKIHSIPDDELDAVLDTTPFIPVKRKAVEAHATQKLFVENLEKQMGDADLMWGKECFVLAKARVGLPGDVVRPVDDLFLGLP